MLKSFFRIIILCAVFGALYGTAHARLVLGVVQDQDLLLGGSEQARILGDYLATELDREVRIRLFDDSERLLQWMLRFRELDLAIVRHSDIAGLPAGQVSLLADPEAPDRQGLALETLVARQGLERNDWMAVRWALLTMGDLPPGEAALQQLPVAGFRSPGSDLPRLAASRLLQTPQETTSPAEAVATAAPDRQQAVEPSADQPVEGVAAARADIPDSSTPEPLAESSPVARPEVQEELLVQQESLPSADVPPEPETMKAATLVLEEPVFEEPALAEEGAPDVSSVAVQEAATPPLEVDAAVDGGTALPWQRAVQATMVMGALAGAVWVVRRRREMPGQSSAQRKQAVPARAQSRSRQVDARGANDTPARQARFQHRGELDLATLESLLQTIATYPRPGTVVIRAPQEERRIHFRQGKISAAFSLERCEQTQKCSVSSRLGSLLVRMNLISEEQREGALELCAQTPGLRLGEALIQQELLAADDLRGALRSQAEGVIFSLFLFPEGHFEVIGDTLDFSAEDDLAIPVRRILDEAAAREEEWSALRTCLPSRESVFTLSPQGRDKLTAIRLTAHQKSVLALVDGRRSLRDISRETTMLDFELYKFIYMMVRAGVLAPAKKGIG